MTKEQAELLMQWVEKRIAYDLHPRASKWHQVTEARDRLLAACPAFENDKESGK